MSTSPAEEQSIPSNARVKKPASGSWLKTASREARAVRSRHGLLRNAPRVHPESSRPAVKVVSTAVMEACMGESRFCTSTRSPAFFRSCFTSPQAFSVPLSGMARGDSQKFTPSGRPPPPPKSPCQAMKVTPPKTSRSLLPPSGKNSGRPPSGAKQTTLSAGTFFRNSRNHSE